MSATPDAIHGQYLITPAFHSVMDASGCSPSRVELMFISSVARPRQLERVQQVEVAG
jgi:hypothetical protein